MALAKAHTEALTALASEVDIAASWTSGQRARKIENIAAALRKLAEGEKVELNTDGSVPVV